MYLKITNQDELHNGLQYHDGLIEDPVPFRKIGSCVPGGIYFTTPKYICEFLHYGPWIREVTIPENAEMVKDPQGDKWRASKVILSPRKSLGEVETWKWLVECGIVIQDVLVHSARSGRLEVVKYLVECGVNIHIRNESPLRLAALYGHLEVVKFLVECGANIHAENDGALTNALEYRYFEIVEYLKSCT